MTKLPLDARIAVEDKLMAVKLPEKPLQPHRPQPTQNAGQLERRNAADSKHIHRLGVIAEHQRPAFGRTPPQTLFSERDLPILKVHTNIGIKQSKPIDGGKRRSRRNTGDVIDRSDELPGAIRLSRSGWGMLVFGTNIAD